MQGVKNVGSNLSGISHRFEFQQDQEVHAIDEFSLNRLAGAHGDVLDFLNHMGDVDILEGVRISLSRAAQLLSLIHGPSMDVSLIQADVNTAYLPI